MGLIGKVHDRALHALVQQRVTRGDQRRLIRSRTATDEKPAG